MPHACRLLVAMFAALYAAAFLLFLIGVFGWFGSPQGPLAGVFLVLLGIPWNLWVDRLPDSLRVPAAIAVPALNLLVLWGACSWRRHRSRRRCAAAQASR